MKFQITTTPSITRSCQRQFVRLPAVLCQSLALIVTLIFVITAPINAAPLTVPNSSFELSSPVQTSTNFDVVPDWVFSASNGSSFGIASIASNFSNPGASTGSNYAFINNDYPGDTDTITSAAPLGTIAPLTQYTLTVAIGNRNGTGLYDDPGNVSFSLLANGVTFATQTVSNGTVPNGTFEDFSLTFTTPDTGTLIGQNLQIQLATLPEQGSAFQPGFDNVTLDATNLDVPEPQVLPLLLSGLAAFCWMLRQRRFLHS
jgi:hypothetical protein